MLLHSELTQLLLEIEAEMRAWSIWAPSPPSDTALQSIQPFCIDTLSFWEWVQWIMIPRFRELIKLKQPLPQDSNIAPLAEEAVSISSIKSSKLIDYFKTLDQLLTVYH